MFTENFDHGAEIFSGADTLKYCGKRANGRVGQNPNPNAQAISKTAKLKQSRVRLGAWLLEFPWVLVVEI
jgi:hypothetical protein